MGIGKLAVTLFKVNNGNTRKIVICSELIIKSSEQRYPYFSAYRQNLGFCPYTGK